MKPRKSPQEKKRLSLVKDRRKRTGGNVHTARKIHAEDKRIKNGAYRSKTRQVLGSGTPPDDPDKIEDSLKGIEKARVWPEKGLPLGEMIAAKRQERVLHHGRRKEFRRLKAIYRKALEECKAAIRKTARYRDATEMKVEGLARARLKKSHGELFAAFLA